MKTYIKILFAFLFSLIQINYLYSQIASDIFTSTGVTNGLCVRIGTSDGALEMQLCNNGNMLVYGMVLNQPDLINARENINNNGWNGVVSVDYYLSAAILPFANNLVNLLVVDRDALGAKAPSIKEIERVVAPYGAYYVKQGGIWSSHILALKSGMAEWQQNYADETNNNQINDTIVTVPTSVQWIADVEVSTASVPQAGFRFSNGKVFYTTRIKNYATNSMEYYYMCRNAANGTLIWKKRNTFSDQMRDKQTPIAFYKGVIYTYLSCSGYLLAIDATNGNILRTYSNGGKSSNSDLPNFVISENKIYLTAEKKLFILDINGTLLWSKSFTKYVGFPTVDPITKKVCVITASGSYIVGREPNMKGADSIYCFNTITYNKIWQKKINAPLSETSTNKTVISQLIIAENKLFYSRAIGISWPNTDYFIWGARNLATGDSIWQREEPKSGTPFGQKLETTVLNGKFYAMSQGMVEFDANTGQFLRKIDGKNLRCTGSTATSKLLLIGFQFFIDPFNSRVTRRDITRSECGTLSYPSYGMIYYTGNRCQCALGIRGTNALSSEPLRVDVPLNNRLTKYIDYKDTIVPTWPRSNEWPTFMCNPERSSVNQSQITTVSSPTLGWSAQVAGSYNAKTASVYQDWISSDKHVGPVTAPVISDSVLVISVQEENKIVAYNAITGGSPLWYFIAGGRMVGSPTLHKGLCIFGAGDGYVYCLKLKTGQLIWKFFAAANDKKIVVHGHVETPWALIGALLIKNDKLIINAGYVPEADGGIYMWCLNPFSGKIIWNKIINRPRRWYDYTENLVSEDHYTAANSNLYHTKLVNSLLYCDNVKFSFNSLYNFNISDGEQNFNPMPNLIYSVPCNPLKRNFLIDYNGPLYNGIPNNHLTSKLNGFQSIGYYTRIAFITDSLNMGINPTTVTCEDRTNLHWELALSTAKTANSLIFAGNNAVISVENTRSGVFSPIGGIIYIYDIYNGKLLSTLNLPSTVITNGIAAAYGKLYFTCEDGKIYCYGNGTNEKPFARAGMDQIKNDIGLDGKEPFDVDGSGSYAPYDSIVSYQWYNGGTLLATGAKKTLELTPGQYNIVLKITNTKGISEYDTVRLVLNATYTPGIYRFLRLNLNTGIDWNAQCNIYEVKFNSGGLSYPQSINPKFSSTSLLFDGWQLNRSPLKLVSYVKNGQNSYILFDNNLTTDCKLKGNDIVVDLTNSYRICPDSIYINLSSTTGITGDSIYLYGSNDQVNNVSNLEWKKIAAYPNKIGNPTTGGGFWFVTKNTKPINAPSPLTANVQSKSVNLQWTDPNNNESGFSVERKKMGGYWIQIADLPANTTSFVDSTINASSSYTYKICAYAGKNISPYSNSVDITTGLFVAAPTNLTLLINNPVSLQWIDNATNEDGFYIERKSGSGNYTVIATLTANKTQYIDNTFQYDSSYFYRIRSFKGSLVSNYSNELPVFAPPSIPKTPSNLTAVASNGILEVTVNWKDNSFNEEGYDIYYKSESDPTFTKTISLSANSTSITLTNSGKQRFIENTTYYFYVVAYNSTGTSIHSNIDTIKTSMITPVKDVLLNHNLNVYPIPTNKMVTVEIPKLDEKLLIRLTDIQGRVVYESKESSTFEINVQRFTPGEYLLTLTSVKYNISTTAIIVVNK